MDGQSESRGRRWWPAILLVLMALVIYLPAIRGEYVWDDQYVYANPVVQQADGWRLIWFEPSCNLEPQYYPLVQSSYWLEYRLWGDWPGGYHITNVLLHAISGVVAWRLLRRWRLPGAWWIAALFVAHPVQVESVAWILSRKTVMSGTFYLLALAGWWRWVEQHCWRDYGLAAIFFLLALTSKTITASLPIVLWLICWWRQGRLDRRIILAMLPWLLAGVAYGLYTARIELGRVGASGPEFQFTLAQRFAIAGKAWWFYVAQLLWPGELMVIYPRWSIDTTRWLTFVPLLLAILLPLTLWWRRCTLGRGPLVAVLFYGGTLFPALGFFNIYFMRFSFVADHYVYLASLGLMILAVVMLFEFGGLKWSRIVHGVLLLTVLLFSLLSWQRSRIFGDLDLFWRDVLAKNPSAWVAWRNYGVYLHEQAAGEPAMYYLQQAVQLKPDDADTRYQLAKVFDDRGDLDQAQREYQTVLQIDPWYVDAWCNLGIIAVARNDAAAAAQFFNRALQMNPHHGRAHNNYSVLLAQLQQWDQAVDHYRQARQIEPSAHLLLPDLVWIWSTHPQTERRNGAAAAEIATRWLAGTDADDLQLRWIAAAALAEDGNFPQALVVVEQTLQHWPADQPPDVHAAWLKAYTQYQQHQPWRQ
ncbi:MAG: hypothetical protein HJJLKODD_01196 [Phycisphaerae bacterium]|nr:hypothetical protein [Phycisphaerae bacterium]